MIEGLEFVPKGMYGSLISSRTISNNSIFLWLSFFRIHPHNHFSLPSTTSLIRDSIIFLLLGISEEPDFIILMASVGHHFTHIGSPSHKSHFFISPLTKLMAPYGHTIRHALQPRHEFWSIFTIPSMVLFIAPIGQTSKHKGS